MDGQIFPVPVPGGTGVIAYGDDTGVADTYVVTASPAPAALAAGLTIAFKALAANTGASTLNVNAFGAKPITRNGTAALVGGEIAAGQIITVIYDGANWQIQGDETFLDPDGTLAANSDDRGSTQKAIKTYSVPKARLINTTAPLTGGGDMSADRTLAVSTFVGDSGAGGASGVVPAPAAGDGAAHKFLRATGAFEAIAAADVSGAVPSSRLINTTAPLTGGGDMSADRTLAVSVATSSAPGVVQGDGATVALTAGVISTPNNQSNQKVRIMNAGSLVGTRRAINFIAGSNVTFTIADDAGNDRVNITVAASGGGGGGGLVLLEQHTAANVATLDFAACISSTYDEYVIELLNLIPATNATDLRMRVSTDGGATYDATAGNYKYAYDLRFSGSGSSFGGNSTASGSLFPTAGVYNGSGSFGVSGTVHLHNPLQSTMTKTVNFHLVDVDSNHTTDVEYIVGSGIYTVSGSSVDALRFLFGTGNITSGSIRVYGVAK